MAAGGVLTTVGKGALTAAMVVAAFMPYLGWGTGSGTAAVGDSALGTEDSGGSPAYARVLGTSSQATTTVTNDTYSLVATQTANASKAISEIGLFSALTAGLLGMHVTFASPYPLNNGDSITFTVLTTFS